jgi:hypothetical protein
MVEKKNTVFGEMRTGRVLNSLKQQRILVYTYYGVIECLNNMYMGNSEESVGCLKNPLKRGRNQMQMRTNFSKVHNVREMIQNVKTGRLRRVRNKIKANQKW